MVLDGCGLSVYPLLVLVLVGLNFLSVSARTASPSATRTARAKVRRRCFSGFTRKRFEPVTAIE